MKRYYAPGFAPIPSQNGVVSVRSVGGFGESVKVNAPAFIPNRAVVDAPVMLDPTAEGLSPVALEMFNAQFPTFNTSGFGPGGGGGGGGGGTPPPGGTDGPGLFKCPTTGAVVQATSKADAAVKCATTPSSDNTKYILIGVAVVAALLLLK